jgi:predicted phosphohydrolase
MLKEVLSEESLLNICLDNITKIQEENKEAFQYVTGYVMFKYPGFNDDQIAEKVNELITDKIIDNLVNKGHIDINWETNTYTVNEEGRKVYKDLLDV